MSVMQYSGNMENPDSFTTKDMDHLIATYNSTINAIFFIKSYTGRYNKSEFDKTINARNIDTLTYYEPHPYNQLISCLAMANDLHTKEGRGPYEAFSPLASIKIRNTISQYEEKYKNLTFATSELHWAFQEITILAFDKLYSEFKKFKSKYKHVKGITKIVAELEQYLAMDIEIIGQPEIEWFDGNISRQHLFAVRDKLSANKTPLLPLHVYLDIMRFEEVQKIIKSKDRAHTNRKQFDNVQHDIDVLYDKNIELTQANDDLIKTNDKLVSEKRQLVAENTKMTEQIANLRSTFVGRILFNLAQRKK